MTILDIFEDVVLGDTANGDVLKQTGDIDSGWRGMGSGWQRLSICQFVKDPETGQGSVVAESEKGPDEHEAARTD